MNAKRDHGLFFPTWTLCGKPNVLDWGQSHSTWLVGQSALSAMDRTSAVIGSRAILDARHRTAHKHLVTCEVEANRASVAQSSFGFSFDNCNFYSAGADYAMEGYSRRKTNEDADFDGVHVGNVDASSLEVDVGTCFSGPKKDIHRGAKLLGTDQNSFSMAIRTCGDIGHSSLTTMPGRSSFAWEKLQVSTNSSGPGVLGGVMSPGRGYAGASIALVVGDTKARFAEEPSPRIKLWVIHWLE